MNNNYYARKTRILALALIFLTAAIALSGCVNSSPDTPSNPTAQGWRGGGPRNFTGDRNFSRGQNFSRGPGFNGSGRFGNLTDGERQQLFEQMIRHAAAACEGKTEGAACETQSPRESRNGTCQTRNGTLSCGLQMVNRPFQPENNQ